MVKKQSFSQQVLAWFDQHGRKNLPWQKDINAYRVWISEIMLQQTQVATVIPYFESFMQSFPTVQTLADAPLDNVLHHWSGLGYYSRAKNLHTAANQIINEFNTELPDTVEELSSLSGIGRSTAGAICSIAYQKKAAILDGNVKRVLARHQGIEGWPGKTETLKNLWQAAEDFTPDKRCNDYSQAMMDLGATCCTRTKPDCHQCPIQSDCFAYHENRIADLPGKKPKKVLPVKKTTMLIIQHNDDILLYQRPLTGIWPGLYSFHEIQSTDQLNPALNSLIHTNEYTQQSLEGFRHTFSHYHLDISLEHITLKNKPNRAMADDSLLWYNLKQPDKVGIAAPVKKIIKSIEKTS